MKKFILSFFIALIFIVVGRISVEASSTFDEEMLELIENSASDYGYNYLGTLENGDILQEIYREIDKKAKEVMIDYETDYERVSIIKEYIFSGADEIEKIDSDLDFCIRNLATVCSVYYYDNPYIYFWYLSPRVSSGSQNGVEIERTYRIMEVIDEEYLLGEERERINKKILEKSKEIKKKTEGYTSKYLITRIVYNEICKGMEYEYDENGKPSTKAHAHDIAGFFYNESGVCETYARVLQFLLRYCGVESIYVSGFANEYHGWNAAKMDDGNWYWFDATWDDTGSSAKYNYFCRGNDFFYERHEVMRERNPYDIPETAVDEENVESFNKLVIDGVEYKFFDIFLVPTKKEEGKEVKDSIKFNGIYYTVTCLHSEKEKIGYDEKCKMCNKEFKHKHDVDFLEEIEPTCLKEGLTEGEICSICGEILYSQEVIPKKEHVLGEWIIEWEATYDYDGLKSRKCEVCKIIVEEEVIPKLVREVEDNVIEPKEEGCNSASIINMVFLLVPIMFIRRKKYLI